MVTLKKKKKKKKKPFKLACFWTFTKQFLLNCGTMIDTELHSLVSVFSDFGPSVDSYKATISLSIAKFTDDSDRKEQNNKT